MPLRVLLVEDYAELRLLMRMVLTAPGEVIVVGEGTSGAEALDLVRSCDPDVVVLDQFMPGMTGMEAAARMRLRYPELPLVLCTAYLDDELRAAAAELGIDVLLSKDKLRELPEAVVRAAGLEAAGSAE